MLQQRLTQASLLAQRSSSATVNQPHPPRSTVSPPRPMEPSATSANSNLRKRKSMASLSIIAPRGLDDSTPRAHTAALPSSPNRPSISRSSPGAGPLSPSYTVLRSPSSSAAASMHVLTSIASRRRQSGTGPESPCGTGNGGPDYAAGHGPRVAFAYPRSPGGSSVQTVRSPGRGRYISSSGFPRFESSGYSEAAVAKKEKHGIDEGSEIEEDGDSGIRNSRKRLKNDGFAATYSSQSAPYRATQPRKSSLTLMPAFSSNTIYGVHHHNSIGSNVEPVYPYSANRAAKKPRAASHSVDSRPSTLRNTISGYKHIETPGKGVASPLRTTTDPVVGSISGARIDIPYGTDASDVDAANGLMSMLGSAPATFNPPRNAGSSTDSVRPPSLYDYPSRPLEARMKVAKPRAASFASVLTLNDEPTHSHRGITSPIRVRRLPSEKTRHLASPSGLKRTANKPDFTTPFSSDEEKHKASASASDEDQQAAEAILFLAASPSPAIAHSSPIVKLQGSTNATSESKVGRVLFDDAADEIHSTLTERLSRGPSSLSQTMMFHQRQSVGESPLHQPPINNTSPSRDRFSRVLPPPLALPQKTTGLPTPAQHGTSSDNAVPPLTASTVGDAEHPATSLSEPTELLSPPHSDHSKP